MPQDAEELGTVPMVRMLIARRVHAAEGAGQGVAHDPPVREGWRLRYGVLSLLWYSGSRDPSVTYWLAGLHDAQRRADPAGHPAHGGRASASQAQGERS